MAAEALSRVDVGAIAESDAELSDLDNSSPGATKVCVTLGGRCADDASIAELICAGASVGRIPVAHSGASGVLPLLRSLRSAANSTKALVASLIDLKGPQLAVSASSLSSDPIVLSVNDTVVLTSHSDGLPASHESGSLIIPVEYPSLTSCIQPNDRVVVSTSLTTGAESCAVYLCVLSVNKHTVTCSALNAAELQPPLLTVRLPSMPSDLPVVSSDDAQALQNLADAGIHPDFVSVSFSRDGLDIRAVRSFLDSVGMSDSRILGKLGTLSGLRNLCEIVHEADGLIVSRGNLGQEILSEKGFLAQAYASETCNRAGKPCIVTRVLDSMVENTSPTRAESTDVANAVLGGCDAIMLGAETVRGVAPAASVAVTARICAEAERVQRLGTPYSDRNFEPTASDSFAAAAAASAVGVELDDGNDVGGANAVEKRSAADQGRLEKAIAQRGEETERGIESSAAAAVRVAEKLRAPAIIAFTRSGRTGQLISKYRPTISGGVLTVVVPQLVTKKGIKWCFKGEACSRQMALFRGLFPALADPKESESSIFGGTSSEAPESMLESAMEQAKARRLCSTGDNIVAVQRVEGAATVRCLQVR